MTLQELLDSLKPGETLAVVHQVYVRRVDKVYREGPLSVLEDDGGLFLRSSPPVGAYKVTNLYAIEDPPGSGKKKMVVEFDDTPQPQP